jgi:N-acetyl-anhydromuramyl-L-alanine amidase AmpD
VRPKANFHFVIDNARSRRGVVDGELETGTAWMNQEEGAPYAGWRDLRSYSEIPYYNASINGSIGICLVGDSNREPISKAQNQKLVQLVHDLRSKLDLPDDCVRFQWELVGQATPAQQAFADNFRQQAGIKPPAER